MYYYYSGDLCQTMKQYQNQLTMGKAVTNFFCGARWQANTVYRELLTTATTASTSGPTLTTTSPTSPPTSTGPPGGGSSGSQAWIAGAVVGPVAAIALAGVAVWWFRRRSQHRSELEGQTADSNMGMDTSHMGSPAGGPVAMGGGGYYQPWNKSEYQPVQTSPAQLEGSEWQQPPSELAAQSPVLSTTTGGLTAYNPQELDGSSPYTTPHHSPRPPPAQST
jgi:hypothetical protein